MPWENAREGVRQKVYSEGGRVLRLVDFQTSAGFDAWCQTGHIGYVLTGGLVIDVNGTDITFAAGDGIFLPAGAASQHRAVTITPGTRLLMVEDR